MVTGLVGTLAGKVSGTELTLAGIAAQAQSAARAGAAYDDSRASQFIESWANLTAWNSSTGVSVSGGRVFSNGTTGGASGASHAISLAPGETMRAVTTVSFPANSATSGGIMVGFSKSTAGVWTNGGTALRGLYFNLSAGKVQIADNGVFTDPPVVVNPNAALTWTVTLTADVNSISVVAVTADGQSEIRGRWTRDPATFPLNNISVFNSDTRTTTGGSIGPLGMVRAIATITPRTGLEGLNRTVHWATIGTTGVRVALPPTYDPRIPNKAVVMFHGHGSDETLFADNTNGKAVANAFLAAGYVVVSAAYTPASSTWGSQNGLDAVADGIALARSYYNLGWLGLYLNSMGGIEGLLTLAQQRVTGVRAVVCTVPTYNLAVNFANATFTATIRTAHGIAADNSDYATKTAGRDPALLDARSFRGLPFWVLESTDDTTVDPAQNSTPLVNALAAVGAPVTKVQTTGGHSAAFSPFTAQMTAFMDRYCA